VPPTDNSAVDGYAVRSEDIPRSGFRDLTVVADLAAGAVFDGVLGEGAALRIMTGAPMPAGAGTVYPQEIVERRGSTVRIPAGAAGVNVRHRGEDVRAGSTVLGAGIVLRPQELGVAASLGLPQLLVRQRPRVAILSTGDEVVEPGDVRKPGRIFDSNRFSLHGLVHAAGGQTTDHGIVPDLHDVLHARLRAAAAGADIVLTSGGVSVGDHDLVKTVLQEAGGIDFWQVAMQPGRPMAVGRIGAAHFFGLPGNPVASMLTFHLFVRPALWKLAGRRDLFPPRFHAVAAESMSKKPGRREFKRGILSYTGERWEVRTTGPQGSGILTSMTLANCFVVIEEERSDVAAGETVWVEPFALA
jgi:molybdopterin molybdotransferase